MLKRTFIILLLAFQCNFLLYGQDGIYELNGEKPNNMLGIRSEFGILMFSKTDIPNAYEYFQKNNYYYKNELSDSQREDFNQAIQDLLNVTRSQTFSLDFLLSNNTDNQKETFQRIFIENIGIFLIRRGMGYFHDEKGKSKIDKIYSETPETLGLGIGVEYKFYLESEKKRLVFKSFAREIRIFEVDEE